MVSYRCTKEGQDTAHRGVLMQGNHCTSAGERISRVGRQNREGTAGQRSAWDSDYAKTKSTKGHVAATR